jgi:hypothetical protein
MKACGNVLLIATTLHRYLMERSVNYLLDILFDVCNI